MFKINLDWTECSEWGHFGANISILANKTSLFKHKLDSLDGVVFHGLLDVDVLCLANFFASNYYSLKYTQCYKEDYEPNMIYSGSGVALPSISFVRRGDNMVITCNKIENHSPRVIEYLEDCTVEVDLSNFMDEIDMFLEKVYLRSLSCDQHYLNLKELLEEYQYILCNEEELSHVFGSGYIEVLNYQSEHEAEKYWQEFDKYVEQIDQDDIELLYQKSLEFCKTKIL